MPAASRQSGSSLSRLFIAGLGLAFLLMNLSSLRQSYLLKRFGTPGRATVTDTHLTRRRGGNAYNAAYTFDLSGKHYEGSGEVTASTYNSLRPGQSILIRYVPSSPAISESAEMSHNSTGLFIAGVLGLPTSLFILFMAFKKEPAARRMED